MLALAAGQADLVGRDGVALVWLFRLVTYSDRDAGTIEAEHWFSRAMPVRYRWGGGAARDFADVVLTAGPLALVSDHLPDPRSPAFRRQRVELRLANDSIDGVNLWATLSAQNLPFARLEIASLAIERARLGSTGSAFWDLTDLPGTEHVVRFRGELTGIEGAGDEEPIALTFESEEPAVSWPELLNATDADPRDVGRRYAIPFGRAKGVPVVNRKVGWATTLSDPIPSTTATGNYKVTSTAGLPTSGSFALSIDAERVTASRVDATTINVSARAQSGTLASVHQRGAPVLEMLSSGITLVVAGVPCVAVDALYVLDRATREPVLVSSALYTVNLDDRATDPGRRLTTVTFTQANLEVLLNSLAPASETLEDMEFNRFQLEAFTGWNTGTLNPDGLGIRLDGRATSGAGHKALFKIDAAAIPENFLGRAVDRIRVRALLNGEGDTANVANQDAKTNLAGDVLLVGWGAEVFSLPTNLTTTLDYVFQAGVQESGVAIASAWVSPTVSTGKTGSDLDEIEVRFSFDPPTSPVTQYLSDNWAFVFAGSVLLEIEFSGAPTPSSLGASATGLNLAFTADVQGVSVPFSFGSGYEFDEGSGWSLANGAAVTDLTTSQRFEYPPWTTLITDSAGACDDHALWTVSGGTKADETTIKTQGSGSIKVTPNAAGNIAFIERNFTANDSWTDKVIAIDLRPDGAGHLSASDGVRVAFEDAGGDWRRWDFGTSDGLVIGQFKTVVIDPASGWDASNGSFTITAIDKILITSNANGAGGSVSNILYVDNIRILDKNTRAIAQRNATAGAIDLAGSLYRLRARAVNAGQLQTLLIDFSNTAGSGTTLPAAYRQLSLSGSFFPENQWVEIESPGFDIGTPSLGNVEMLRIEIARKSTSIEAPTVELEFLKAAAASNPEWDGAAPGTLLELGPDAIRYFVGEFSRMGAANVLGVPTAKTNLAGVAFAGTFDSLGDSFASVLSRLAYETRTNVLVRPSGSGLVFELANATAAGAYPAAAVTLLELRAVRETARGALATPSSFRAHYAPELADGDFLGLDERAFRGLLVADASASDVAAKASTSALAAIAAKVGARAAEPMFFLLARDLATAADVFGFYVAESIRTPARRWSVRVPISEAYALLPFDVVALRPRWLSVDVKARVVAVRFPLDAAHVELDLAEVL